MTTHNQPVIGKAVNRVDGPLKVTGRARYAAEHMSERNPLIGWPVSSDTAVGEITNIDTTEAERADGVSAVITYKNAGRLSLSVSPPTKAGLRKVERCYTSHTSDILVLLWHWLLPIRLNKRAMQQA